MSGDSNLSTSEVTRILNEINDQEVRNLLPVLITVGLLMVVGLVGNVLVLCVYWLKQQRTAKQTFIIALALLDLCVCIGVVPSEMYDLTNQVTFSEDGLCKCMRFLEYFTVLSAGFVLVAVSFERYYFLCKAFREFSVRKAKFVCLVCVLCAMVVASPAALFAGSELRHFENYSDVIGSECSMNSENNENEVAKRVYYYFLCIIFAGCVITFAVLYSMIGRLLWKYRKEREHQPDTRSRHSCSDRSRRESDQTPHGSCITLDHIDHQSADLNGHDTKSSNRKRRNRPASTTIVFFSVTIIFVMSFLPHLIMRLLKFLHVNLGYDRATNELLYNFVVRSYLISNVTNPFIYSILNRSFRTDLIAIFRKWSVCEQYKCWEKNRKVRGRRNRT